MAPQILTRLKRSHIPNTRTSQDLWSWNGPLRARCDHYLTSPELTAQGLLLGPRIRVLRADCTKAAATPGSPSLGSDPLDGDLPRARALLSVAYGYPISPWQMSRLQAAAAVTGQRPALAGIILAHAGLSRIPATPAHAERLYHAEKLLDSAALSPIALLDALDLLPDDWAIHKNHRESQPVPSAGKTHKFDCNEPRVSAGCPEGGQFTFEGGGTASMSAEAQSAQPVPVRRADCSIVQNARTGGPLLQPSDVSLTENAKFGNIIARLNPIAKAVGMLLSFLPGGMMDYQRTYGQNGLINRTYIDFGNYNYGVVAAAAGYSLRESLIGAAFANHLGSGKKTGWLGNNPRNVPFIEAGWNDYNSGKIMVHDQICPPNGG